jgi:polar amino acid transport system substrate-binding protein
MTGLAAGDVMAVLGPTAQFEFGLRDGLGLQQPPLPAFSIGKWAVGVGMHFTYRPLLNAVDYIIFTALNDGRL